MQVYNYLYLRKAEQESASLEALTVAAFQQCCQHDLSKHSSLHVADLAFSMWAPSNDPLFVCWYRGILHSSELSSIAVTISKACICAHRGSRRSSSRSRSRSRERHRAASTRRRSARSSYHSRRGSDSRSRSRRRSRSRSRDRSHARRSRQRSSRWGSSMHACRAAAEAHVHAYVCMPWPHASTCEQCW